VSEQDSTLVLDGCALATLDAEGREYPAGHIEIAGDRIAAVGPGPAPAADGRRAPRMDAQGLLATPGLVNCHHHLHQWLTRGLATDAGLFEWLETLYPVWAHLDAELQSAAARAGLAALALSGCSTTTDHHYIWPADAGELLEQSIHAAGSLGLRFHPCRGSMDLGRSDGGLPPDDITEDRDAILAATAEAVAAHHDRSYSSMVRIAVAPCSPFSVSRELMAEAAELARSHGVRLHTHLAETTEENEYCLEHYGMRPVDYLDDLGWLGDDVWLAHCIHLNDAEVARFAATGTSVAHCPSSNARLGAGIAPARSLLDAGAAVGLGVDGAASNEAGELAGELRQALLVGRLRGGPGSLDARRALDMGTRQGARCLGRGDGIGSLEPGKLADVALWRLDDLGHAGIGDPVAALVLGPAPRVHHLIVNGRFVVENGHLSNGDEDGITAELHKASRKLSELAGLER
jgi:cytosine/adenosine deaminase-related metal-dependent hydrolase